MTKTKNKDIGFDPGFGNTKAAYVNGQLQTIHIPSVVGIGSTELGLLSVGSRRRGRSVPEQVSFKGVTYLVGDNVANFARPVERMDFVRLGAGRELEALFYTSMYGLLGEGTHNDVRLIVGLPVEVMQNKQKAKDTRRQLRNWMLGRHQYFVNGFGVVLDINRVEVMAQPSGSYFSWGMNNQGEWIRPNADLEQMIAICDIGFNTVDLFVVQKDVVTRYTDGKNLGMRRASELLINHIRQVADVSLSLHEADKLLKKRTPQLSTAEGLIDLTAVCQQATENIAAGVMQFTEQTWGNAKQFRRVLFTGGGAEALRSQLARHYPHGIVLPETVTANAAGFAKFAMRNFR